MSGLFYSSTSLARIVVKVVGAIIILTLITVLSIFSHFFLKSDRVNNDNQLSNIKKRDIANSHDIVSQELLNSLHAGEYKNFNHQARRDDLSVNVNRMMYLPTSHNTSDVYLISEDYFLNLNITSDSAISYPTSSHFIHTSLVSVFNKNDSLLNNSMMNLLHIANLRQSVKSEDVDSFSDDDTKCGDYHKMNISDMCVFTTNVKDCDIDQGFIRYTRWIFCTFPSNLIPIGLILMFLWWLFLFVALAVTADDFFCPALSIISKTLNLSHNIAGVTFLAFGNGAPDIFSALSAINSGKSDSTGLAFGALFGAGMFVTTVVVGAISIIQPFDVMRRPFMRDVIFYIGAAYYAFYIMWDGRISLWESVGFIVLYIVYVIVVIVSRLIRKRCMTPKAYCLLEVADPTCSDISSAVSDLPEHTIPTETFTKICDFEESDDTFIYKAELKKGNQKSLQLRSLDLTASINSVDSMKYQGIQPNTFFIFLHSLIPIPLDEFKELSVYAKIYEIVKAPICIILKLTIPLVDHEVVHHNWNRPLNSLHLTTSPLLIVFLFNVATRDINGIMPIYGVVLIIGGVLSILLLCFTSNLHPPRLHSAFAYLGFLVSMAWIYGIANEIVNILQTFGVILNINASVLGLTLLAWGNSIGDLIADIIMARKGFPRVGISACFGGPLFNLLLGVGIPFTIQLVKRGEDLPIRVPFTSIILAAFLLGSLVQSLVIVSASRFRMTRAYGVYLWCYYCVFLVVALLTAFGVIVGYLPHRH